MIRHRYLAFCVPVLIACGQSQSAAGLIYWSTVDGGSPNPPAVRAIYSSNPDGSNAHAVVPGLYSPAAIALDPVGGKIYYVDGDATGAAATGLWRANLDGTGVQNLTSFAPSAINEIDLDLTNGKIYWTDYLSDTIRRVNFDGTNPETVLSTDAFPSGLALDAAGGKIYFSDSDPTFSNPRIRSANLDGSNIQDVLLLPRPSESLELDLAQGFIYWAEGAAGGGSIGRAKLDGTMVQSFSTGTQDARQIALDLDLGKIYWSSPIGASILRANLDGTGIETFQSGYVTAYEVAVLPSITAVPEPPSVVPASLGVFGLALFALFRRRARSPFAAAAP
jgi:DNA-binding beta-propeller fold protein YncE